MKIVKGIDLVDEIPGEGRAAEKGDIVTYNARFFLRRGDEVTMDAEIISRAPDHVETRIVDGVELIDHVTQLGRRHPVAGVERTLYGMCRNGYREVIVAPHLAYGKNGVPGRIPPDALLRVQVWVRDVRWPDSLVPGGERRE